MRRIEKGPAPEILENNRESWLEAYLGDRTNSTNKYRYRHEEIKAAIRSEAHKKCVYCESKVGHNCPGDTEHYIPSSIIPEKHFDWDNLLLACSECNRRKSNYYDPENMFLNPFVDDVENEVIHAGPIVLWKGDSTRAEITIKMLDLGSHKREELIERKIERISMINELAARISSAESETTRALLIEQLQELAQPHQEYSGMSKSLIDQIESIAGA